MINQKIAILIPIYNESKNIEILVSSLGKIFKKISKKYTIIFIDDNSQDGTLEILKNLSKKYPLLYFIRKNERGYGSALKFGFEKAKKFDIIITMDGDLSHDVNDIPNLLDFINKGNDIVIGSRYIHGGKIKNWPIIRRITSKLTNTFTKIMLNTQINDNTSGYRVYKSSFIKNILNKLNSNGYSIGEEILFLAKKNQSKISEIPVTFQDRTRGKSKANMIKEAVGLFKMILRLRKKEIKTFMKYCLVGFFGIFVNEGVLYTLTEQGGLYYLLSGIISIELSIIFNFIFNDLWTFKNRRDGNGSYINRMFKFNITRIFTALINFLFLFGLTTTGINYLVSNFIGIIIAMFLGFKLSTKWVWKK